MRRADLLLGVRDDWINPRGPAKPLPVAGTARLFNKSLGRAGPACHREPVRAAECQLSTPKTTVN
jgi:hypothetical protein